MSFRLSVVVGLAVFGIALAGTSRAGAQDAPMPKTEKKITEKIEEKAPPQPAAGTVLGGDVKPKSVQRITISGDLKLTLAARNEKFFQAALGNATNGAALSTPLGTSTGSGSGGDVFWDPNLSLIFDFQLADRVNAVVELETPFNVFGDAGGANTSSAFSGSRRQLDVEQAYVQWLFHDDFTLFVGVQDYKQDLADSGNPFLIDVTHSESPFNNPGVPSTLGATVDYGSPQSSSTGLVGTQEAAGGLMRMQRDDLSIDLFYFTINETFRKNSDDVLWGGHLEKQFDGDWSGKGGVTANCLQNDAQSYLWTLGAGGNLRGMNEALKLYGEGYVQGGKYNANAGPSAGNVVGSSRGPLGDRDIDQEAAYAMYGGMRFYLKQLSPEHTEQAPSAYYFDGSYWEVSGDDDGTDSRNSAFVSLENNNDTVVVEDGYYGLDIDSNYRAVKVRFGGSPRKDWDFEFLYAYFELQDNSGGVADNTPAEHNKIGDEFDINLYYRATDYLTFRFATGWLISPDAIGLGDDINVTTITAHVKF